MSHFKISSILPATDEILSREIHLVLLKATNVPPHLALFVNGQMFTLNTSGPQIGSAQPILRMIRSRNLPSLFVNLTLPEIFTPVELLEEVKRHLLVYPRADPGIATCLSPIKDFCASVYDPGVSSVSFVFELMEKLNEKNIIRNVYHLNMEPFLKENNFYLKKYSMEDIQRSIV